MRGSLIVFTIVVLALCTIPDVSAGSYSVRLLGVIPGHDRSEGFDINDHGVVLGMSSTAHDMLGDVFTWQKESGITDLSGQGIYFTAGINNQGQMVGIRKDEVSGWFRPLIRDADGSRSDLVIPPGVADVWPGAINELGQVGVNLEYRDAEGTTTHRGAILNHASGEIVFIDTPSGHAGIGAISDTGFVAVTAHPLTRAYLWSAAGGLQMLSGLTASDQTRTRDVNNWGYAVGMSGLHAVRWGPDGNVFDLGLGTALGINDLGQIIGSANDRAVMWDTDGSAIDLGLPDGASLSWANAINNNGQVVGGAIVNEYSVAVLWEPIPEPSSILALAAAVTALAIRRRR